MNITEARILTIFNSVESVPGLTQRRLAGKLGVALGTVNQLIQGLIERDWISMERRNGKPRYKLTPAGQEERFRLSRLSLNSNVEHYARLRDSIAGKLNSIEEGKRRIVLYGAGPVAEIAFVAAVNSDYHLVGVVDETRKGESFFGHLIAGPAQLTPGHLNGREFDMLVIASCRRVEEISRNLSKLAIPDSQICRL